MKNSNGLVGWVWRLTAGLSVTLMVLVGSAVALGVGTKTGEKVCLQFARPDRRYQATYPTVLDISRGIEVSLTRDSVPDAVVTVSENSLYRIRQSYHFKRIFSVHDKTVVETIGMGVVNELPSEVSKNSVIWSPDGSQFAYYTRDTSEPTATFSLVVASADGSNSITTPLTQFNQIHYLNWSRDGLYLLVADYFHIWLIQAADRQVQVIEPHKENERVDTIEWSPQGHILAYLWADTTIIPNNIVIFDPDSAKQQRYARADARYWWNGRLLWSDDLRYVAAVGWTDGLMDIMGVDGSGASLPDVGGDGTSTAARWLPASDRFIYITKNNELVAYDAAAGSYQLITSDPFNVEIETIGDQHSIIFIQKQPDTTSALVKLDVRDNRITTLLTPQPKGRVIRFHVLSDRTKMVVVLWEDELINVDLFDINSGERQPLARGLSNFTMQRIWSAPNTFMFFWNILDKNTHQLIKAGWDMYDLAGKRQAQFQGDKTAFTGIYDGPQFFAPFWSPDRHYAVFTGIDPDVFKGAIVMSSDGQQAWQIKEPIRHIAFNHIRWSPDSSKVVFVVNIRGESIGLIYTAEGKLLAKAKMPLSADYLQWTDCDF